MNRCIALVSVAALAACQSAPPPQPEVRYETVNVEVPVPIACVPEELSPAPVYPDSDQALLAADTPSERYRLIIQGRAERQARLTLIEPVIESCKEQ